MHKLLPLLLFPALASLCHAGNSPTLTRIRADQEIVLGIREASIPFNYLDDNRKQAGYAWEIALRVVGEVRKQLDLPGLKVTPHLVLAENRIAVVTEGKVDLECSSTSITKARQAQVGFSIGFFITGSRLLVPKESPINDWSDLDGRRVVVGTGTTAEETLHKLVQSYQLNVTLVPARDISENFFALESGRADAAIQDEIILSGNVARSRNPLAWKIVGQPHRKYAYGCMFAKDDPVFAKLVNTTIADMMASGELRELYRKYFERKIAVGGGINLNRPLSIEMHKHLRSPRDVYVN